MMQTFKSNTLEPTSETLERRQFVRKKAKLQVHVNASAQGSSLYTQTEDVSVTGVFIRAYNLLPIGTVVRLSIIAPAGLQDIKGTAQVVRHSHVNKDPFVSEAGVQLTDEAGADDNCTESKRGMGLQFLDTDQNIHARIGRLISKIAF